MNIELFEMRYRHDSYKRWRFLFFIYGKQQKGCQFTDQLDNNRAVNVKSWIKITFWALSKTSSRQSLNFMTQVCIWKVHENVRCTIKVRIIVVRWKTLLALWRNLYTTERRKNRNRNVNARFDLDWWGNKINSCRHFSLKALQPLCHNILTLKETEWILAITN